MNAGGMAVLEICDLKPFIGAAWINFWQGEDRKAAQAAVQTARGGGIGRFVGFFPTTQTRKPMWFDVAVSPILDACRNAGLLVLSAGENVLRLVPPLIIEEDHCDRALEIVDTALRPKA